MKPPHFHLRRRNEEVVFRGGFLGKESADFVPVLLAGNLPLHVGENGCMPTCNLMGRCNCRTLPRAGLAWVRHGTAGQAMEILQGQVPEQQNVNERCGGRGRSVPRRLPLKTTSS